jgi:NAD(P)-dependent dehydrogenase (short-subunit alcohol dehydrogenase family)
MARFDGQVAVVTGGATGLGHAIAQRLAQEGARVVLFDRDGDEAARVARELAPGGATAEAMAVDITDETAVARGFAAVAEKHGGLHIAVNSAGIVGPNGRPITEVAATEFDEVIRVNLRGSFLVTKYALPPMLKAGYGRVLLIASISGKEGNAGMAAYSTSKAGVIGLAKAVGKEFAESGVTINALAPAVVRTKMVDAMVPEQVKYMTDKIPMKRCGTLDEVAAMAAWICSREASFSTGFTFDLSGGRATY